MSESLFIGIAFLVCYVVGYICGAADKGKEDQKK